MTARIEPSEITARDGGELGKRQHVPFRVIDSCPRCGDEHVVDLGAGDHLSYAKQSKPTSVYFSCAKCDDHEWQVRVVVRVDLVLAEPPASAQVAASSPDTITMRDVIRDLIVEGRDIERSKSLRDKIREVVVNMRDRQGNILASNPQLPAVIEKIARAIEENQPCRATPT